jgi:hypothetical protein
LREIANGQLVRDTQGFVHWLMALQSGSSSLPGKIPLKLLLAWRNGHANHPAGASPVPIRRCEDFLPVLPNCTVDGFGPYLTPCPACGSDNISHKKLSGNDVDGWDPMWVYTPLRESFRKVDPKKYIEGPNYGSASLVYSSLTFTFSTSRARPFLRKEFLSHGESFHRGLFTACRSNQPRKPILKLHLSSLPGHAWRSRFGPEFSPW